MPDWLNFPIANKSHMLLVKCNILQNTKQQ